MRPLIAALLLAGAPIGTRVAAQDTARIPFGVGERLTFHVQVAKMGATGKGAMWVEGPVVMRGTQVWVLHFDSDAGVGPFRGSDRTASWIDPQRMASLRFTKNESHLFSRHKEDVEMHPAQRHWQGTDGSSGDSPSDAPLDELSFIYFLRTLPLDDDSVHVFTRFYDERRNPTTVQVVAHEQVKTGLGMLSTLVVEMCVKDPAHYKGDGVIRINLTDDARRIPVRIESMAPDFGKTVVLLETYTPPTAIVAVAQP